MYNFCEVKDMLLAVDCGNTQVVLGVFDQDKLLASWRISTNARRTADEYMVCLLYTSRCV